MVDSTDILTGIVMVISAYLLSSLPVTKRLVQWRTGEDLSTIGTGNAGIANAFRYVPKWVGFLAVAWQVLMTIGVLLIADHVLAMSRLWLYLIMGALLIGNLYPVFSGFAGSKGRTILLWGLLYLQPWLWLYMVASWGILYKVTGVSRKAVNLQLVLAPFIVWYLERSIWILTAFLFIALLLYINNRPEQDDFALLKKGD